MSILGVWHKQQQGYALVSSNMFRKQDHFWDCHIFSGNHSQTIFAPLWSKYLFWRFIDGLGNAATYGAMISIIMTLYPDDTVKIMSWTETTFGLGYSLGPAVGVFIYDLGGFKLPFIVVGLVALVLAITLIILIPGKNFRLILSKFVLLIYLWLSRFSLRIWEQIFKWIARILVFSMISYKTIADLHQDGMSVSEVVHNMMSIFPTKQL